MRRRGYRDILDTPSIACTWFTAGSCIKIDAVSRQPSAISYQLSAVSLLLGIDRIDPFNSYGLADG